MSDLRSAPTPQLHRLWRGGDAQAGQAMAQRFSDWYYAVTASRLGDVHGRVPLQRSCTRFQQGIVSVAKEGDLVDWAHGILAEELRTAGGRIPGGDFPNQLTGGRSPAELLAKARTALPPDQVRLLAHAYDSSFPLADLTREAETMGGMPLAVLRARYTLKAWLRQNGGVAFSEVPADPNLDYAPLPIYEAGRMSSAAEETNFEKWLLSNMALCKDIAEFGVFALALRGGAFRAADGPNGAPRTTDAPDGPAPRPTSQAPTAQSRAQAPAPVAEKKSGFPVLPVVIGGLVLLGLLAAVAAVAGGWLILG